MPRVHKKFYSMADPRFFKIQAFKQPHSSCGLDNYNVIDPRSEALTNSSMNSHSPQKQPCRMTSGSAETDLFLHSKTLTRGQWILHLRPCGKMGFCMNHILFHHASIIHLLTHKQTAIMHTLLHHSLKASHGGSTHYICRQGVPHWTHHDRSQHNPWKTHLCGAGRSQWAWRTVSGYVSTRYT